MSSYFSYPLTATQTLTFGYIKWTTDVAFIAIFLDIVFGHFFRRGMGKTIATKTCKSPVFPWRVWKISPMFSCSEFHLKWVTGVGGWPPIHLLYY